MTCLVGLFPEIPRKVLLRVCVPALDGPLGTTGSCLGIVVSGACSNEPSFGLVCSTLMDVGRLEGTWRVVSVDGSGKGLASKVVFSSFFVGLSRGSVEVWC